MDIRPIRTEEDYKAAMKYLHANFETAEPGTPEGDKVEVLSLLVWDYEQRTDPVEPPHPIDAILYAMDKDGLTRRDLEPILGGANRVSEILNKRRYLTLGMIRALGKELGIGLDVLVQPYELAEDKARRKRSLSAAPDMRGVDYVDEGTPTPSDAAKNPSGVKLVVQRSASAQTWRNGKKGRNRTLKQGTKQAKPRTDN